MATLQTQKIGLLNFPSSPQNGDRCIFNGLLDLANISATMRDRGMISMDHL